MKKKTWLSVRHNGSKCRGLRVFVHPPGPVAGPVQDRPPGHPRSGSVGGRQPGPK